MADDKSGGAQVHGEGQGDFELGTPAIVCRWRLSGGSLPLENRHLRALLARTGNGKRVTRQLVAWAKQHIEWTLAEGSIGHADGVLMVVIDCDGKAAMTVGDYQPLTERHLSQLCQRAISSRDEAFVCGVAPEVICAIDGETLVMGLPAGERSAGAVSLVEDLARTIGMPIERREDLAAEIAEGHARYDEVFLVSDEHGIVTAEGYDGSCATRMREGYQRLLERECGK